MGAMAGIDARTLGKPDTFHGEEAKWADRRVIVKACAVWSAFAWVPR